MGMLKNSVVFNSVGDRMTKQNFKDECDINVIMRKYQKSGQLPIHQNKGVYGDFSGVGDYQQSMNIILKAQEQFDLLDSKVRKRFKNDPVEFLEFVNDPANLDEMYALGLAIKPLKDDVNEPKVDDGLSNK